MWRWQNQGPRVVRAYIAALNARDIAAVERLVGRECILIDSRGASVRGHTDCVEASRRFFALDLDYELQAATISASPPDVLVSGKMLSNDPALARDCLWRARTKGNHLVEWQSFAKGSGLGVAHLLMPEVAARAGTWQVGLGPR